MEQLGIIGLSFITINCIVSFLGIRNPALVDKYCFEVDKILINKQYYRLITSGFFHVGWMHLFFNMFSLYFFSSLLEGEVGHLIFLLIYLVSLIGGNLLALLIHKNNSYYRAIGASGAVSGIIFSSIALFPGMELRLWPIPVNIPSWIYGLIYILITIYGIRSKKTNIGHEAHLGGALAGMLLAIGFYPEVLKTNFLPILFITIPSITFIILFTLKPGLVTFDFSSATKKQNYTIDDHYNEEKVNTEKEMDRILEKIHKKGMNSLSEKEKQFLNKYSAGK
jgi:membrane associated rhomboid family serine protease